MAYCANGLALNRRQARDRSLHLTELRRAVRQVAQLSGFRRPV